MKDVLGRHFHESTILLKNLWNVFVPGKSDEMKRYGGVQTNTPKVK
jgi:hypothetical protein